MKWQTIALINGTYQDKSGVFQNSVSISDVTIQKKPGWMKNWVNQQDTKESLSFHQRCVIEDADYCFLTEYEADALDDPDPIWKGERSRSKQEINAEKIMSCNLALWIAKPSRLNFEVLAHFQQNGEFIMRECSSYPPLLQHVRDDDESLTSDDIALTKNLLGAIEGLERNGSVWMSVRTLWTAVTANAAHWYIKYLMIWIALEALFGTNSEIAHRLSERIAFFLAQDKADAKEKYRMSKKCYDWRSKIVHGRGMEKIDPSLSAQILYDSERFVRESLQKILLDRSVMENFNGNKRDDFLDELIFQT